MSYMASTAIRGKNVVGGDVKPIMPSPNAFRVTEQTLTCEAIGIMKEALSVSEAYGTDPEVMDRR